MPHFPKPFFREPLGKWYVQIDKKQVPVSPWGSLDGDLMVLTPLLPDY